ncbi:MAG: formylglycine-generating enzyme family protein [Desulfobacterales bacterium]|nr:formylglycine-generating enzyme family protein [Desulfobacterales bacterium]
MKKILIILSFLVFNNAYADTKLYVHAIPENAVVKILNIKPKFKQGIPLKKGTYRVSVYLRKHVKKEFEIKIGKEKKLKLKVTLIPKRFTNSIGMEFVYIHPGSFMMGSPPDELGGDINEPLFKVTLTKGFYIQITEVSEGHYKKNMGYIPSEYPLGENFPIENVSWKDANKFINKLNNREEAIYRLPTEAEWEYACRAGTKTPFSFGNCINSGQVVFYAQKPYGNCKISLRSKGKFPVKSLKPNKWGLYHMHGNLRELCLDYWGIPITEENKKKEIEEDIFDYWIPFKKHRIDYVNKVKSPFIVVKGGSWSSGPSICRSASRSRKSMVSTYSNLGFRVVKTIDIKDFEIIE